MSDRLRNWFIRYSDTRRQRERAAEPFIVSETIEYLPRDRVEPDPPLPADYVQFGAGEPTVADIDQRIEDLRFRSAVMIQAIKLVRHILYEKGENE